MLEHLCGLIEIPQSGAALYTFVGAKTVATVVLAPDAGLNRKWRRFAETHDCIICAVRADLGRTLTPDAFHRPTLLWALYSADLIQVWSAPFPQRLDDLRRDGLAAREASSRFQTTIETTEQDAPDWLRFIEHWKRKATPVRVYGPKTAEVVR